jgi:hypothetical protein
MLDKSKRLISPRQVLIQVIGKLTKISDRLAQSLLEFILVYIKEYQIEFRLLSPAKKET